MNADFADLSQASVRDRATAAAAFSPESVGL
jgi:hypothetical protein